MLLLLFTGQSKYPLLFTCQKMVAPAPKPIATFDGMTHLDIPSGGSMVQQEHFARYGTAWRSVYIGADQRYLTYLRGDEQQKKVAAASIAAPLVFSLALDLLLDSISKIYRMTNKSLF